MVIIDDMYIRISTTACRPGQLTFLERKDRHKNFNGVDTVNGHGSRYYHGFALDNTHNRMIDLINFLPRGIQSLHYKV